VPKAYGFIEYGGPDTQRFLDVPKPVPGPDEVLVRVHAAGLNPVDWKVRAGMQRSFLPLELPAVLGREVAGVVEEVGSEVSGLAAGDRVFGSTAPRCGGYTEYTVLPANRAARIPDGLSFTDAAALPIAAGAAHDALAHLGLRRGGTLLVLGVGGGVGIAMAQLARLGGLTVVGTASSGKVELLEPLDVTVIPYDRGNLKQRLGETLPRGVDGVVDLVGGDALRSVGVVIVAETSVLTVADPQTVSDLRARPVSRVGDTATLEKLAALTRSGQLDPHVRQIFPFHEAGRALELVEAGHAFGKTVLQVLPNVGP